MPECKYCSSSFEDEAAYADHLETAHANELSRIDQRRIDRHTENETTISRRKYAAVGVGILAAVLIAGAFVVFSGSHAGGQNSGQATNGLPSHGNQALLKNVTRHPSEGRNHVPEGTNISYNTTPPTSGPHYPTPAKAGFYTDSLTAGNLVHSLEHGAVVIYYDPSALTPRVRKKLKPVAHAHTGRWKSVIVVPNPTPEPNSPYVLTAWRTTLRLHHYDSPTIRAFLAEYLGRGPEHPVR